MIRKIFPVILCLFLLAGCNSESLSGNQWLLQQTTVYEDLEQASNNICDLFSLHLIGAVKESDFKNEVRLLITLLQSSQTNYRKSQKEIAPGSHSYASKCGLEALDNAYQVTLGLLEISDNHAGDPEMLAQEYLSWRETFITEIAAFLTAKNLIMESEMR